MQSERAGDSRAIEKQEEQAMVTNGGQKLEKRGGKMRIEE